MDLFEKGLQVNTIKVYRAAISTTLEPVDNHTIGTHPVINKLFKGFFQIRPKKYKNTPAWNVGTVLEYIQSWGKTLQLNTEQLTLKLAILMALSSACRSSELASLDMYKCFRMPDGIRFQLTKHKKNHKDSQYPGMVFFPTFPECMELCPVYCFDAYANHTLAWRLHNSRLHDSVPNPVFRALSFPHNGVTSTTISRWITRCITGAGFTIREADQDKGINAHTTRSVATTVALQSGRLTMEDILQAADWSGPGVFLKHYYKPQFNPDFGRTVLWHGNKQLKVWR